VRLTIYDASGRTVRRLLLGKLPTGTFTDRSGGIRWDGCNDAGETVASGAYVVELRVGEERRMRRVLLRK